MSNETNSTDDKGQIETVDELRSYIHQQIGVSVDGNDPIMILHIMHLLFLRDYERMLSCHNTALTEALSVAVKGLTSDAISKNLQEQIRLADRTHQEFERQYNRIKFLTVVNTCAALVCMLVFFYLMTQ